MTSTLHIAIGLGVGGVASVLFFGGLAATVRRLPHTRRPALLATGSFFARAVLVAVPFVWAARTDSVVLVSAAVAFLVTRQLIVSSRFGFEQTEERS